MSKKKWRSSLYRFGFLSFLIEQFSSEIQHPITKSCKWLWSCVCYHDAINDLNNTHPHASTSRGLSLSEFTTLENTKFTQNGHSNTYSQDKHVIYFPIAAAQILWWAPRRRRSMCMYVRTFLSLSSCWRHCSSETTTGYYLQQIHLPF